MDKINIYLLLTLVIILAYVLVYFFVIRKNSKEHFTTEQNDYESRLQVMKVFDMIVKRKPTTEEVEKYSKINNEQDLLVQILQDYTNSTSESAPKVYVETPEKFEDSTSDPIANVMPTTQIDPVSILNVALAKQPAPLSVSLSTDLITVNKSKVTELIESISQSLQSLKILVASAS
jgi:hypothetical protein